MKKLTLIIVTSIVLMLSGCVGLFIAGAATTANLVTDPRTTQEIWDDNFIESEITGITTKAPYRNKARITSSSFRGMVILMGQSPDDSLVTQLMGDVKKIKGVSNVHNEVRIREPLSTTEISKDSWITAKVKSELLTDKRLSGIKVKVITEDKEVFLLGYLAKDKADIATEIARNVSGVKRVIRAFQYDE